MAQVSVRMEEDDAGDSVVDDVDEGMTLYRCVLVAVQQ
jgi:hypothetical protein